MYNDFKLIDEEKLKQLMESYNKKIKVKVYNANVIETNCKQLLSYILEAKHYIANLQKNCSNSLNYEILNESYNNLSTIHEKLKNLYEITEIELLDEKKDENTLKNIQKTNVKLIESISILFEIINYEDNIKIKNSLKNTFEELIFIIKKVNTIEVLETRIISFFKKK